MTKDYKFENSILIIKSGAFVNGMIGGMYRLFNLAESILENNRIPILLSNKYLNPRVQKILDEKFPGLVIRTEHTGCYPKTLDHLSITRKIWRGVWKIKGLKYYNYKLSLGWGENFNPETILKKLKDANIKVNLLWAICGGYIDAILVAYKLHEILKLPFIIDFWDPPIGCGIGPNNELISERFKYLLAKSKAQITVTFSYKNKLLEDYPFLNEKNIHLLYFCYNKNNQLEEEKRTDGKFKLVYTGSLGGGRQLFPVLKAIEIAANKLPAIKKDIEIHIAGVFAKETIKMAMRLNLREILRFYGLLDSDKCEKLAKEASLIIVIQSEESSRYQIPGKIFFECFRLKKRTLAIMPKESEAALLIQKSGLGEVFEWNDIDNISNAIINEWTRWKDKAYFYSLNENFISNFSNLAFSKKVKELLKSLDE